MGPQNILIHSQNMDWNNYVDLHNICYVISHIGSPVTFFLNTIAQSDNTYIGTYYKMPLISTLVVNVPYISQILQLIYYIFY